MTAREREAAARLDQALRALGVHDARAARILEADGTPTLQLRQMAKRHGISLSWILDGEIEALLVPASRWLKQAV